MNACWEVGRGKVVVIGNVATELFLEGTGEQIEDAVRRCVGAAAGQAGYILSSGWKGRCLRGGAWHLSY